MKFFSDYTALIVGLASALTVVIIFTTLTLIKYRRKIKELMTKVLFLFTLLIIYLFIVEIR